MRFGLVGTGHWARTVHAPALAREPEIDFAGVWGRVPERAASLAGQFGVRAYQDYHAMVEDCDAIAFAVPPDVQAKLAMLAAGAGKHLLLEKPIATSVEAASSLETAVDRTGVASVVFFSCHFDHAHKNWLTEVAGHGGDWQGGWATWITAALSPGSPYGASAWRSDKGALWDVGPHALSILLPVLGDVVSITAQAGARDLVHLILAHESGASSTVTLTLTAPPEASHVEAALWGQPGLSTMPASHDSASDTLRTALRELTQSAMQDKPAHPCDVHFGRYVVEVLAAAEDRIHGIKPAEAR